MKPYGSRTVPSKVWTPVRIGVLTELARGLTKKEIGVVLGLEIGTIKYHIRVMFEATNTTTLAGLVARCLRNGVIA